MALVKGGLKYLALFFIMAWVFFLGILVGRGTAPVQFDTEPFQERLASIAERYQKDHGQKDMDETELIFYSALEKPVPRNEDAVTVEGEIVPGKVEPKEAEQGDIPLKMSRKQMTLDRDRPQKTEASDPDPAPEQAEKEEGTPDSPEKPEGGKYTVQVAAYRDFKDALKEMANLESKGFDAYKTLSRTDEGKWHRVRTGSFETKADALEYREKLRKNDVDGMVIQKE